jgi:hypothetical protein
MGESATDRALAVFKAYEKTGVTGVTTSTLSRKFNDLVRVTPVTRYASTGVTGVTSNDCAISSTWPSVTPVTPVTPQKTVVGENSNAVSFPYAQALNELERRCPDFIEQRRWQQCIDDAQHFIATWGPQAEALEWSSGDLFALHAPPEEPHPSYRRLSRYDATGLIWNLAGHRVVALSSHTAAVAGHTGSIIKYHKVQQIRGMMWRDHAG